MDSGIRGMLENVSKSKDNLAVVFLHFMCSRKTDEECFNSDSCKKQDLG